jgi:hypothetical protein
MSRLPLYSLCLLILVSCAPSGTSRPETPVVQTSVASSPAAISASPAPSSPVQIVQVQITATDAVLELTNTGGSNTAAPIDLDGWSIQVGSTRVVLPASTRLAPGRSLLLHAGPATGSAPSPLPVPSASASASPAPRPSASPSAVAGQAVADIFLGPTDGPVLRQALQPGVDVDLVDDKNTLRSRFTLPRS